MVTVDVAALRAIDRQTKCVGFLVLFLGVGHLLTHVTETERQTENIF